MKLAWEITSSFYNDEDASRAQEAFIRMFQKKDAPDEMREYQLVPGQSVTDVLVTSGSAPSRGDARRLVDQKGVKLDGVVLEQAGAVFPHPGVLQVGKTPLYPS